MLSIMCGHTIMRSRIMPVSTFLTALTSERSGQLESAPIQQKSEDAMTSRRFRPGTGTGVQPLYYFVP